ncbi:amidohydrolase family protein, partial [Inconstantimicrobium porci]|uniref:amidohydrolase family protein n=1 Tax=Inconstantimicrobium porci TaxID=2652291 RepID=UPI0024094FD7
QEYNLPIVCHTGGCEEAGVIHVYNAAKKHPEVNFVMVHMGLGTDNQEAIELLGKLPNLYGDTTWVPIESTVQAVKLYGSEKIFFGSDNPIDGVDTYHNNPKGEKSVYQKYFNELEELIGKENYDNIMFKNAQKVFNIKHIFTF